MSDPVDLAPPVLAPVPPSLAVVGAAIEARVRRLLDAEIERWTLVDAGLAVPLARSARSCSPAASGFGPRSATGRSSAPAATPTTPSSSTSAPRSSCCTRSRSSTTT